MSGRQVADCLDSLTDAQREAIQPRPTTAG